MTLKKMDIDKDGRICYEDFETTVISNFQATWRKGRAKI